MEFEKWYKERIESNTEAPPESVWEEVQNALDVDNVWDKVSNKLNHPSGMAKPGFRIFAAVFLILIASAGMIILFSDPFSTTDTGNITSINEQPVINKLPSLSGKQTALRTKTFYPAEISLRRQHTRPVSEEAKGYGERDAAIYPDGTTMMASLAAIPITSLPVQMKASSIKHPYYISVDNEVINKNGQLAELLTPSESPSRHNGYFGLSLQYANTWMRNNKTASGLKSSSLVDSRPSFGKSAGLIAGMPLGNRLEIKVALDVISEKRQSYHEYLHGQYVSTGIDMDYTKFALMAGYRIFQNKSHQLAAGMYGGYLNNATQYIDGEGVNHTRYYKKSDYGIVAGYEYTHHLGSNVHLGTGIYVNYGLNNVFSGSEHIPSYLNRTNLLSFNLGISLGYSISKGL